MPVKAFLMSDIRNKGGPASPASFHRSHVGSGTYNRFDPISPSPRVFTFGKRLLSDDNSEISAPKVPRIDSSKIFAQLKAHDSALDDARKALAAADLAIAASCKPDDGGVSTALKSLSTALACIIKGNDTLKSAVLDSCKVTPTVTTTAASAAAGTRSAKQHGKDGKDPPPAPPKPKKPQPTEEELTTNKVKKALREIERKTVMFDLDLGNAPTINKETISKKVTLALHEKGREGKHDYALTDAAEMLDDVLSCSQLEFLGSGTRKFYNKRDATDKRNGKICTVPVRLEFKNKETRFQAESTIRKLCKVRCSVPYPKRLRTLINDMITEGKKRHDGCFIRTKVDIDNLSVSASAKVENKWVPLDYLTQVIPLDILDKTELPTLGSGETPMSQDPSHEEIIIS